MLTRKQKELLFLIRDRMESEGIPPSFDEMKAALGLRSKSGIHRLITGLEERGFIRRLPHRARALEIIRLPDNPESAATRVVQPIKDALQNAKTALQDTLSLPVYGRIAAGTPIEAISDIQGHMDVPLGLIANARGKSAGDHYLLEISGDSMIEAGIMNGDQVIIRRAETADNGAIIVALIDGHEATLKYLQRDKGSVTLVPANTRYEPRTLPADRVQVQGKLVGLMRKY
ncbi:MAG: transcriptional repressor LexA [Proteobacteria bacterium]|jgi:repressor LexA|nr:transcriptional repressor LexA [Alphaproteobacteria bacterium]NCC04009.1 transcriptional repressor LexA [Pseudomonadota bacterium]